MCVNPVPETRKGAIPYLAVHNAKDADAFTSRAAEAGLKVLRPAEDQFYGDRGGKFEDPFGHRWRIASRKEDLSPGELMARAKALDEARPA